MVDRKAKAFAKDANYGVDFNRLRDRMNRRGDVDCLMDMDLRSNLRKKLNRGVANRKYDMDDDDLFDESYLSYLLELEKSSLKLGPIEEVEVDPEFVMFLEYLKDDGNLCNFDVPIQEDVSDPQYLMFLENLTEYGNSYMVDVPVECGVPLRIIYEEENVHFDDVMKRKIPRQIREYNIRKFNFLEERNHAKKTGRILGEVHTTQINRNRGESTEKNIAEKKDRGNASSYGVRRNTPKKRTRGENRRKNSHSTSHVRVQEKRNIALKNNKRNVGSYGVNSVQKAGTCGKGMKRNNSCSSTDDCYVLDVMILDSSEASTFNLKDSDVYNRMEESLDEDVQEKRTVGEVIKKRKLMPHTGNHIKEEKNLNVSNGKKSLDKDVQEKRSVGKVIKKKKLITHTGSHINEERNLNISNGKKSGVAGHFLGKQTTEKNNPISVGVADFQDKERTEKKNPIPLNLDCFEEQCVNVIVNSISAPKDSSIQKSVVNEVYDLFLKNLKVIGESVVYEFGDNQRVLYELSSERRLPIVADSSNPPIKSDRPIKKNLLKSIAAGSSDQSTRKIGAGLPLTVRVATEKQRTHPSTSSIPASRWTMPLLDKQLYNSLEVSHRVPSNMRKKLLVILSQPYSKEEHEQLWKEVSLRSAVLTHRDSRSGGSHRPGQMGRSLLDWNPDLSSELDKVKSYPLKVLNLLRMLSFYIKKLPCGNICKPWMDDTIMSIIHGSA